MGQPEQNKMAQTKPFVYNERMPSKSIFLDFWNRLGLQSSPNTDTQVYFIAKMPYNCSKIVVA
jgi:hypothetical protein